MAQSPERWHLRHDGREHLVEIADAGLRRRLTWTVDGDEVATRRTSDERVVLTAEDGHALAVRLPALVGPARRVTLYDDAGRAHAAVGGVDLDPEAGSKAAEREQWIRAHPHLHTGRRTIAAALGVAVPLLLVWLLARIAIPAIDWPDISLPAIPWPDIPWPDLPDIPWPDLPAIPWPDVSLPDLPAWVEDAAKVIGPVLLAFMLARGEVRRRRQQDEHKRHLAHDQGSAGSEETEPRS